MPAKPLGAYLIEKGVISKEQLDLALPEAKASGELLGEVLIRLGFASADDLSMALAEQAGIPRVELGQLKPDPDLCVLVTEPFARKHTLIPVSKEEFTLTVAMANIFDVTAIDERRNSSTGLRRIPG